MRTLAWMTLQIVIVAAAVWLEYDMAPLHDRAPNIGAGIALGIVFAFIVTGSIVVIRDKLSTWRARRVVAPSGGVYLDTRPGSSALGGQRDETRRESHSLAAPAGSSRHVPEDGVGPRIGK